MIILHLFLHSPSPYLAVHTVSCKSYRLFKHTKVYFSSSWNISFHSILSAFFFQVPVPFMNPPAGKTVPKMNNQSLKNACFQSPAYFQKSKLYFSKSKPYFFESKVSFFWASFIPKMNSAIIPVPFGQTRSSVSGFSVIPLPSNPCHPAGRPVSQKTWHTYNVRVRVRALMNHSVIPREPCPFTPNSKIHNTLS